MDKKESLELRRQFFHLCLGIVMVLLLYYKIINAQILLAVTVLTIILSGISLKIKLPFAWWFLKTFERPEEIKRFPNKGTIFFLLGCLLAVVFFPKDTALASIAILGAGDSVSHVVGRFYGSKKHPFSSVKMVEGSIAGTVAAFFAAVFFVSPLEALAASVIAMLVEAVEIKISTATVDDNVTVPVVAGAVISLMRIIR